MRIQLPEGEVCEIPIHERKIEDILRDLRINPLDVIIVKNGRIVPEDDDARNDDFIRLIGVKSGG